MARRFSLSVTLVLALAAGGLVAQVAMPPIAAPPPPPPPGQIRDPGAVQQPTSRQIPVGRSAISGTVFTADTGRPVRGARVTISGTITASGGVSRGSVTGAPGVGAATPVGAQPLRGGISINLSGGLSPGLSRTTMTDAQGQFTFPRLPSGTFTLSVFHNQYLQMSYGQKRPGGQGTQIQLAEGQQLAVKFPVMRGAVITGMVIGEDGEPQRNAQVRGWRYSMNNGFKRLQSTGFATTDDRGVYRMFNLQPGDYVISATPTNADAVNDRTAAQFEIVERAIATGEVIPPTAPGMPSTVSIPVTPIQQQQVTPQPTYLPTYSPSALVPSGATTVTVNGNEERPGVDIQVRLAQASTVQGTITTPLAPGVTVQVSLLSDDTTVDAPQANSTNVDPSGRFTFRTVSPGKYTVYAQTTPARPSMTIVNGQPVSPQPQPPQALTDAQKLWGKASVSVDGQATVDVAVSLQASRSISGMVTFEMERPPDLSRMRMSVSITPAPAAQSMVIGPLPNAQVGPDGRFTLTGVMPGRLILRASGAPGLKSALIGGQDSLDFPFEFTGERDVTDAVITLTDKISELGGTLTDSSGKPAMDYTIIVAASDNRYWSPGSRRISVTRPSTDGKFSLRGLPPGSYLIAAVTDLEQGAQFDPEFLRAVSAASVPITIMEGGKVTQDLRVR